MRHPYYRRDIDGLRGVAIVSVLGYHFFPSKLPGGFIGVDIFFVISGYLISTIILSNLHSSSFSFMAFYRGRIRRIFPALITVLLMNYILVLVFGNFNNSVQIGKHIAGSASFLTNIILWNESSYFDIDSSLKPLLHLWSLAVEEQFYLLWPVILFAAWKVKKVSILIFILGTCSLTFSIQILATDAIQAFYSPLSRFCELLIGAVLASINTS
jgi:hypothetical protein